MSHWYRLRRISFQKTRRSEKQMIRIILFTVGLVSTVVLADYDCVCNYAVERSVFPSPNNHDTAIGTMYEFDCKASVSVPGGSLQYKAIAFEHKLGYVELDQDTEVQVCQGDPPSADILISTTTTKKTTHIKSTQPSPQTTTLTMTSTPFPTTHSTTIASTTTGGTTTTPTSSTVASTTTGGTTTTPTSSTVASTTTGGTTTTPTSSTVASTTSTTASTATTIGSTKTPTTSSTVAPTTTSTTTASTRITSATTNSPQQVTTIQSTVPTAIPLNTVFITGSPLAYIGVGYNLLYGNPSGLDRSNGGGDLGMHVHRRIFQLTSKRDGSDVDAIEAEVTSLNHCVQNTSSFFVHDGRSYQKELLNFVDIHTGGDGNWTNNAFLLNQDFIQVRQHTEGGEHTVYKDVVSSAICESARYKEELAGVSNFGVSREFAKDVCQLSLTYNYTNYFNFIEKWGTNIVMAVKTGTLTLKRYQTTPQQVLLHLEAQRNVIFHATDHYGTYPTSVTINTTQMARTSMAPFGALIDNRQLGTNALPVPVHVSLSLITDALDKKYWTQIISHGLFVDSCSHFDGAALDNIRTNMNMALQRYTMDKTAGKSNLHDIPMTVPMTWPYGTYGLMKAASGCPGSNVPWQSGWRKYDTEDSGSNNYFSPSIQSYLSGLFQSDDIVTNFCMKSQTSTDSSYTRPWPPGTYCILKKGNCPAGFSSGRIHWDDDDFRNHNADDGVLPDGDYGSNTDIYYCCRNDGSPSHAILLPRDKNFILLRFIDHCQTVFGMTVHEVFVRWDDEDLFNGDSASGAHPYDDGGSKDHKLHFCHYTPIRRVGQPSIVG